ncbi:MAG: thioesterase family protein [Parvibaculum sp.]|uniref:acyl-CoA thioesterase n=1 Tax=Parvibaculum sp. TaxID=2024848 RepID=UPI0027161CA6|nr:thioesterase family protein [Parvibaculum sp.]MDO8838961.1 thioesterase family protein [Parvibaculum sp.]
MTGMIDTYRGYVSMQECDEMGHMNIQHYISKSSDSSYNLRVALGLAALDQPQSGLGYVALEHHIRFHRELRTSDLVTIRSGIVELRDKTMRIYQEMREVLDDRLAATYVVDTGCLDLATRRLTAWPGETRRRAEAMKTALPPEALPRALPPEALSRDVSLARADADGMVETNRSVVNTWECDTNNHMNARFFMARFSDAQGHMWAHAGLGRHEQAARGLATATVEMRLAYFRELRAGETIVVRTGILGVEGKTIRYRHWLFSGDTGEPACAAEGAGLLFDRASRKAVALPEALRARV